MTLNFQFECISTILLLKNTEGKVVKISREVPESFYCMKTVDKDVYFDQKTNTVWSKKTTSIELNDDFYSQEEYTDITNLWNQQQNLINDLETDNLTKISNSRAVNKKKNEIISNGKTCVLVMCDVNSFKSINDIYGHVAGDKCLVEVAKVLKKFIGPKDLVARIGGDEFLFIFDTDDINFISDKMKKVQLEVKELGKTINIPLSISTGVSLFKKGDDWERQRELADFDSYQNKAYMKMLGTNRS